MVVNVENQKHETYIELPYKSRFYRTNSQSHRFSLWQLKSLSQKTQKFQTLFHSSQSWKIQSFGNHYSHLKIYLPISITKLLKLIFFFLVTFSRKNNLSMGRSQSSPKIDESGGGGEGGDTFQSIRNCFPLKQNQVKSDLNCPILLRNQSHRLDSTARVYHG